MCETNLANNKMSLTDKCYEQHAHYAKGLSTGTQVWIFNTDTRERWTVHSAKRLAPRPPAAPASVTHDDSFKESK